MVSPRISAKAGKLFEQSVLTTDVARALRSSLALAAAWTACLLTGHADAAMIVAPTAQNVAMLDVRGDYRARLAILLSLTVVMGLSVLAGTLTGNSVLAATLTIGVMALIAGCWRHFSGDYGANFALSSGLLFCISLSQPGDWHHALRMTELAGLAGLSGILVQLTGWFVRPQHALRHAVAEAWVASSDLITAMRTETNEGQPRQQDIAKKEGALRETVDRTLRALEAAISRRNPGLITHLDAATQLAARLATRTSALHTALEEIKAHPGFDAVAPTLDSVLRSLANAARSAALTIITHRPEQLMALEVRLRRATDLLQVLDGRLAALNSMDAEMTQARELLRQLIELLPTVRTTLADTVDHGAAHSGFALRLPELSGMSVRSLGFWLNPPAYPDAVLVRYTLRVAVLLMIAVAIYKGFELPRGYWIALTALVVLQPDYGATRQKAGQRILGTLAGSVLGSLLLWVKMPVGWHIFFAAILAFCFAFYVKRNYVLAVFFVTLMVVLITEAIMPVHLDFTLARVFSALAGGAFALLAAVLFWPKWEQERSPHIIASALRANRKYLKTVGAHLTRNEPFTGGVVLAKREAERANSLAAASLHRLLAEPARLQNNVEQTAALTTYNQRLTRAITVLALQLNKRSRLASAGIEASIAAIGDFIESLANCLEASTPARVDTLPNLTSPAGASADESLVYSQLTKIVTEVEAMNLAINSPDTSSLRPS